MTDLVTPAALWSTVRMGFREGGPWVDAAEQLEDRCSFLASQVEELRLWLNPFDGGDPSAWIEGYKEMEAERDKAEAQVEQMRAVVEAARRLTDGELGPPDPHFQLCDALAALDSPGPEFKPYVHGEHGYD